MSDNKIKGKIQYHVPEYDAEALEETIILAKRINYGVENRKMTEVQSIVAQVRFVSLKACLLKSIIACFITTGILFEIKGENASLWIIMSISIPLLCVGSANEIYNLMLPDLKGLLMTVKCSIRKIILIRLILFGIVDFMILLLSMTSAFLFGIHFGWTDVLYIIALYNLMCGGCIYILNHTKETNAIFTCSAWGCSLTIVNLIIKNTLSEVMVGKEDIILLSIILLSVWKTASEIKNMLGGLQQNEISGEQFV